MRLESQVCSLELGKKLKELGIKQESYFIWANQALIPRLSIFELDKHELFEPKIHAAFTVAELMELLPSKVIRPEGEPYNSYRFGMSKGIWVNDKSNNVANIQFSEFYSVNYYCDTTSKDVEWLFHSLVKNISDENAANALAKMLIYLIENKLIEIH